MRKLWFNTIQLAKMVVAVVWFAVLMWGAWSLPNNQWIEWSSWIFLCILLYSYTEILYKKKYENGGFLDDSIKKMFKRTETAYKRDFVIKRNGSEVLCVEKGLCFSPLASLEKDENGELLSKERRNVSQREMELLVLYHTYSIKSPSNSTLDLVKLLEATSASDSWKEITENAFESPKSLKQVADLLTEQPFGSKIKL